MFIIETFKRFHCVCQKGYLLIIYIVVLNTLFMYSQKKIVFVCDENNKYLENIISSTQKSIFRIVQLKRDTVKCILRENKKILLTMQFF